MLAQPPTEDQNTVELHKWRQDVLQRVQDALDNIQDCTTTTLTDVLGEVGVSSDD